MVGVVVEVLVMREALTPDLGHLPRLITVVGRTAVLGHPCQCVTSFFHVEACEECHAGVHVAGAAGAVVVVCEEQLRRMVADLVLVVR